MFVPTCLPVCLSACLSFSPSFSPSFSSLPPSLPPSPFLLSSWLLIAHGKWAICATEPQGGLCIFSCHGGGGERPSPLFFFFLLACSSCLLFLLALLACSPCLLSLLACSTGMKDIICCCMHARCGVERQWCKRSGVEEEPKKVKFGVIVPNFCKQYCNYSHVHHFPAQLCCVFRFTLSSLFFFF